MGAKKIIIGLVRIYQRIISPIIPPSCRYQPSCSQYMVDAVDRFGPIRGSGMGLLRILFCNPLFIGGPDPIPNEWPGWKCIVRSRWARLRLKRVKPPDREDDDIGPDNERH